MGEQRQSLSSAVVIAATPGMNTAPQISHGLGSSTKRKRGAMHLIRTVLYMLSHKSSKSKSDPASNWKKLVGSIRPLHVHSNQPPSPLPIEAPPAPVLTAVVDEHLEVFTPPFSPAQASTSSYDRSSMYASANNLQELDKCYESDEEDEEDGGSNRDDNGGDEMIDVKAEQFIAQFYQQMRLQREAYRH